MGFWGAGFLGRLLFFLSGLFGVCFFFPVVDLNILPILCVGPLFYSVSFSPL